MSEGVAEPVCDQGLAVAPGTPLDWLWYGIIARVNLFLLTGRWTGGKTSLLPLLLARRKIRATMAGWRSDRARPWSLRRKAPPSGRERALQYDFGG